jgi:glycolate oxidase
MSEPQRFSPVTLAIVAELRALVGDAHVIYADPERMEDYSHDETAGESHRHMPDVVVLPGSAGEVAAIMRLANRERVPVTPRGAGSGLSEGAVPVYGGILLSLTRLNRILEIDRANMLVVVEPGVITNDINEAVREYGLFHAGYPMSVEMCSIGGNVAENAGGGRAIKYGVTGRYILGLQVVLPTGEIVEMGGKRLKDVTGYDLVHLMVGSEGTLGIVTRIILRLQPLPAARAVLLVPFRDVRSAIALVPRVMTEAHVVPSAIEFMDRAAIYHAYEYMGEHAPRPDIGAMLLIEVDGSSQEQVETDYGAIADLCLAAGALDVYVGDKPADQKRIWTLREKVPRAVDAYYALQISEDSVVPPAQIPDLMLEMQDMERVYGVQVIAYGHAGDGNLHLRIIKPDEMAVDAWRALYHPFLDDFYRRVARLGGTISAEHGIGSKRAAYLPFVMDETLIALQKRLKAAFDPLGVLNPGKIFP